MRQLQEKSKLEASQLILHLSRYGALILTARWMLISVSQHSTAFLCNFDTLMLFITKTSQRADRKKDNTTVGFAQVCAHSAEKEIYAAPAAT